MKSTFNFLNQIIKPFNKITTFMFSLVICSQNEEQCYLFNQYVAFKTVRHTRILKQVQIWLTQTLYFYLFALRHEVNFKQHKEHWKCHGFAITNNIVLLGTYIGNYIYKYSSSLDEILNNSDTIVTYINSEVFKALIYIAWLFC